eukprot:gene9621-biopygen5804
MAHVALGGQSLHRSMAHVAPRGAPMTSQHGTGGPGDIAAWHMLRWQPTASWLWSTGERAG